MNEIEEMRRVALAAFEAGDAPEATLRLLKDRYAIRSARRSMVESDEGADRRVPTA